LGKIANCDASEASSFIIITVLRSLLETPITTYACNQTYFCTNAKVTRLTYFFYSLWLHAARKEIFRLSGSTVSDPSNQSRLLCRIVSLRQQNGKGFQFSDTQIDEKIYKMKIPVIVPNPDTGLLPLRYAIRTRRLDVINTVMKYGASPMMSDADGILLKEIIENRSYGYLTLLTNLLYSCNPVSVLSIMKESTPSRHSMKYWLKRSMKHILPANKLKSLNAPRLNYLKYRIVGQPFAIEQVLRTSLCSTMHT